MSTAWLSTIIAIIIIFIDRKTDPLKLESIQENAHSVIGLICAILAFIQPFMAFARPGPDSPKRWIFNISHFLVGTAAMSFAISATFLMIYLDAIKIDQDNSLYVAIIFTVMYLILHFAGVVVTRTLKDHGELRNKLVICILVVALISGLSLSTAMIYYIADEGNTA